jgi:hypothetical protein
LFVLAATKAAVEQAQAQHDSQAEQVGSCLLWVCCLGFELAVVLATKAAEEQAQAQHDSQAEQVGSCWLWGFAAMGSKLLLCNKGGRAAGAARQPGRAGAELLQLNAVECPALGLVHCVCAGRKIARSTSAARQLSRAGGLLHFLRVQVKVLFTCSAPNMLLFYPHTEVADS